MGFPRSSLLAFALVAICLQSLTVSGRALSHGEGSSRSFRSEESIGERRKTLGFGPSLPHATFVTDRNVIESVLPFSILESTNDPFVAAAQFARALSGGDNDFQSNSEVVLRKDSYTDPTTGLTHAFFRQRVYGKEIVDGHLAVNVHRGRVVSFSDSVRMRLRVQPTQASYLSRLVSPWRPLVVRLSFGCAGGTMGATLRDAGRYAGPALLQRVARRAASP